MAIKEFANYYSSNHNCACATAYESRGLATLEVLFGLMGIPIIIIQFLTIYATKKMIDEDKAWKYNVRAEHRRR
ncbi:hypothetical protein [Virgibacillus alimentarius]|uniref:Uncharacterized protein n=1 Tax=Virgibacillus alimentarius TaxID=698769 RepID=A0ABS4SBH3_9BACI|nr:hypothetical protein [Virgibacillus alimentarius]